MEEIEKMKQAVKKLIVRTDLLSTRIEALNDRLSFIEDDIDKLLKIKDFDDQAG
jgi:hypothetical protein